jgi:hypothetical protein
VGGLPVAREFSNLPSARPRAAPRAVPKQLRHRKRGFTKLTSLKSDLRKAVIILDLAVKTCDLLTINRAKEGFHGARTYKVA